MRIMSGKTSMGLWIKSILRAESGTMATRREGRGVGVVVLATPAAPAAPEALFCAAELTGTCGMTGILIKNKLSCCSDRIKVAICFF